MPARKTPAACICGASMIRVRPAAMDLSYILNHLGEERDGYHGAVSPPIVQSSIFAFPTVAKMRVGFADEYRRAPVHARQQSDCRHPAQEDRRARRRRRLPGLRQRRGGDVRSRVCQRPRRRSCGLRRPSLQLDAQPAARPAAEVRRLDDIRRWHRCRATSTGASPKRHA